MLELYVWLRYCTHKRETLLLQESLQRYTRCDQKVVELFLLRKNGVRQGHAHTVRANSNSRESVRHAMSCFQHRDLLYVFL